MANLISVTAYNFFVISLLLNDVLLLSITSEDFCGTIQSVKEIF